MSQIKGYDVMQGFSSIIAATAVDSDHDNTGANWFGVEDQTYYGEDDWGKQCRIEKVYVGGTGAIENKRGNT